MKVLVIRLTSMGDVILAGSLLPLLKARHPGCEIHFLTDTRYRELFRDDSRLASVSGISQSGGDAVPEGLAALRWDLVVDLQNSPRSRRLRERFFAGAPTGSFDKLHRDRFLLLFLRVNRYERGDHVAARYAKAAGIADGGPGEVPPPSLEFRGDGEGLKRALFAGSRAGGPTLALAPFSAWKNKQWPSAAYASVGKHFAGKGWNVVVLGGPRDRDGALRLCRAIGEGCASCAGDRSLYDLGCLLARCDLALGNDTGLSHLARACGVRTGVVYGSTTWHFGFYPFGEPPFRVFETPLMCRPCHPHGGNVCWRLSRPCLQRVSAGRVIAGLEELAAVAGP